MRYETFFGAIYADAYLLHRWDITSSRLRHDVVLASGLSAVMLWFLRRRRSAGRQLCGDYLVSYLTQFFSLAVLHFPIFLVWSLRISGEAAFVHNTLVVFTRNGS